jgi:hypothetical protein
MLMWRDGAVVAIATIHASEHGIAQIMWIMRPSKLAAISLSCRELCEPYSEPEASLSGSDAFGTNTAP